MPLIQCGPFSQFVFELVSRDPTHPPPPPPSLSLSLIPIPDEAVWQTTNFFLTHNKPWPDIQMYCNGKTPTTRVAACLSEAATRLRTWLAERGLCINVNKTKAMFLPPEHQQCPADILIRCCDATLSIVNEYKYLGVIIDSTLSWEAHVDSVVSKVAKKIGTLRCAGNLLTQAARRLYYLSVIQSDLQYGTNAYWTTLTNARQNSLTDSFDQVLFCLLFVLLWKPYRPRPHYRESK